MEPFIINVDLKKDIYTNKKVIVTANDTNDFVVNIFDDGITADLTGVTSVRVTHTRSDKGVVVKDAALAGNQVTFTLGTTETLVTGSVKAVIQLFDAEGRSSTLAFTYEVRTDPTGKDFIQSSTDKTIIEIVLSDGPLRIQEAIDAAEYANAQGAATDTIRIATEQERLAIRAQQTNFEITIDGRVDQVEAKSEEALTTANLTKAQADLIIGQTGDSNTEIVDSRLGADLVPRATSGTLIREIHTQQLETARQTTTLVNGLSIISGGVDALAETEIEGRTLIPLGNSNLEANKQYAITDKKTKVVVDGVTQSGVAKFTKGTTTVSTANYLNKLVGNVIVNPHSVTTWTSSTTLQPATASGAEFTTGHYNNINTLNGVPSSYGSGGLNGVIHQTRFNFNIIEEIERKLGIIPKSTLVEKVQWIKDNVESILTNWHGFGSSVAGNKAALSVWYAGAWGSTVSHTNGSVFRLSRVYAGVEQLSNIIDANGFVYYLAHADASDAVTPSSVSTDYIDLVVTLKATAQLNTRPTIIRVENFEGKVSGSVVENAHVGRFAYQSTLQSPNSGLLGENDTPSYTNLATLNSVGVARQTPTNGNISQQLFSFNVIEAIERNIGKIPRTSVANKVLWIKENVARYQGYWHGLGSSVGGNRAIFSVYSGGAWVPTKEHSLNVVSVLDYPNYTGSIVQTDGFIHYLAHTNASDGTTASTISTDYVYLEVELKPTADFTRPKVALYEVNATDYAKILVDWSADEVVNRYPIVEGVQHLQGVGVLAEGENLLPSNNDDEAYNQNANGVLQPNAWKDGKLEVYSGSSAYAGKGVILNLKPNQIYTLSLKVDVASDGGKGMLLIGYSQSTNELLANVNIPSSYSVTFTPTQSVVYIRFLRFATSTASAPVKFYDMMLNIGTVAKPFVPCNPSYYFADVKLGAIGTVADRLYEQDGAKYVRKLIEKDVVLDGSIAWGSTSDFTGYKRYTYTPTTAISQSHLFNLGLSKYNGNLLRNDNTNTSSDTTYGHSSGAIYLTVSDTDTGFGETFAPTTSDIKRYFNGWKYSDGVTWTSVTGNGQTATAQIALDTKPTDYTPHKLSYVLATPQIVNVTDKVEGQLKVNGLTQVEALSGIVRREKVTPVLSNSLYRINESNDIPSQTSKRTRKILAVYKNGIRNTMWTFDFGASKGDVRALLPQADYDTTAEYTVTYIALDKPTLTANPTNIKLLYANNMRSSLEDVTGKVQDGLTQLSVHEKALIDLYVRVKALEV